jgi:hypothetical protein
MSQDSSVRMLAGLRSSTGFQEDYLSSTLSFQYMARDLTLNRASDTIQRQGASTDSIFKAESGLPLDKYLPS